MTMPGSPGYSMPMDPITRVVREIENLKRDFQSFRATIAPIPWEPGCIWIDAPGSAPGRTGERIEINADGPSGTQEIRFFYDDADTVGVPIVSGLFGDAWDLMVQGKDQHDHGVTTSVRFGIRQNGFFVEGAADPGGPGPSFYVGNDGLNPGGGVTMNGTNVALSASEAVLSTTPIVLSATTSGGDPGIPGSLFVKSDGALYYRGYAGTVTKIANA